MKKTAIIISALMILMLLCSCTYAKQSQQGCFKIMYGSFLPIIPNADGVCVCSYTWDGNEENMEIVIPDKYNSHDIKKLGGYYGRGVPAPFTIDDTSWMNPADGSGMTPNGITVSYDMLFDHSVEYSEIVYHDFDLYIGNSVDGITGNPVVTVYTVDGVKTAYCPRVTAYCDADNETFYAYDGKLYYRENDQLVDEFIYAD